MKRCDNLPLDFVQNSRGLLSIGETLFLPTSSMSGDPSPISSGLPDLFSMISWARDDGKRVEVNG